MGAQRFDVMVLGAGMVGAASAAQLALRGARVALVDRQPPGEGTSFGNAGYIDDSAFIPHPMPRDLGVLLARLRGTTPHVRVHLPMLPRLAGWFRRYWRESTPERIVAAAERLSPLAAHAVSEHRTLAAASGASALIRDTGVLRVYRSEAGFRGAARDRELMRRYDIELRELDPGQVAELEPNLAPVIARGVLLPRACHTVDPGALTKAYAALAESRGGRVVIGDAARLERGGEEWTLPTAQGAISASQLVVALGPWAPDFLARFGIATPIAVKRGYHMHYAAAGNAALGRPIGDVEIGYAMSPMAAGIRLTTGAEFAARDAPPTPLQLAACEAAARDLFPLDRRLAPQPWMGARPCTPDSAPIIGAAPGQRGMWLAIGHGHWGLGLGAATGRLVAELVSGATPVVDPAPLSLARFA